jgi:hypothetical protein
MTNSISQLDVDALKKLRLYSTRAKKQDPNSEGEITCHEIFAGGFSCIQEHRFQKTLSYMRRAQSFNASILPSSGFETAKRPTNADNLELNSESSISNDSFVKQHALSSSQSCLNLFQSSKTLLDHNPDSTPSNKRISLNDYVCLRAKSNSHLTASTANTPNSLTCVPKPDEHQTNDMNNNNNNINSEAKLRDDQPPLPSLSLIDELKKRINEDNLNKENHSNDETYKSVCKDDENGFYSGSSKERKAKKRHRSTAKDKKQRKKGRKKSKVII